MGIEMSVPTVLLVAILSAFVSFGVAFVTNRAQDQKFQQQLAHDRDLKNREREMSLRRDVYLGATEAVWAGLLAVSRFADLEIPHGKLYEGYLDKAPSIAKVHIIAKDETVKAVMNFSGELNATFLRLSVKRSPLVGQKQQVEVLKSQAHEFNTEQLEQSRVLAAKLYQEQLTFIEDCLGETRRLGHLLMPVIFSVRKELELPIDEVAYGRAVEAAADKQLETLNEVIKQLRSRIASGLAC